MFHALPASFAGTSRPIRRGRGLFRCLALLSLFTLLCGGIALTPSAALASSTTTTDYLNLRTGPGLGYGVILVMPAGAAVDVTGDPQGGFYPVTYNGTDGFASSDYLAINGGGDNGGGNSVSETGTAWVIDGALNLRAGPSTDNSVLTVMPGGATVTLTGSANNGFLSVNYNGTDGWAYADYLSATQPSDNSGSGNADNGSGQSNDIVSIIYAAADKYGQPRADMLRVAECESNLDPNAVNPSSGTSGLFQFMPSTFASTPYASYSIFDPWASANAAGWMWSVGRRGEWACQ